MFESVDESDVIDFIKDIIQSKTQTGKELKTTFLYPMRDNNRGIYITQLLDNLAKDIYEKNKPQFDRMFKCAKYVNLLGAGSIGVAFDIGDRILKVEVESTESYSAGTRAEKAATALYPEPKNKPVKGSEPSSASTDKKTVDLGPRRSLEEEVDRSIGKYVPMIYDKGVIVYSYEGIEVKLNWIIMEKFETIKYGLYAESSLMQIILDDIKHKFLIDSDEIKVGNLTPEESLEKNKNIGNYDDEVIGFHKDLGKALRLKNGWFEDLVQGMWRLHRKGITDFHVGNLGVRRSGGEGSLVFFD